MNTVLEAKDLCKTYVVSKRQNNVLRNVNFKVEQGEMLAIMGPSGSGKSTLLYAVSGMDSVTPGSVLFGDQELTKMNQKQPELQKEKKSLILSLTHDINTPLSAIKLYSQARGSGLGLYICRQLAQAMGGEAFARIREGGMEVSVVLQKQS